MPEIRLLRPSDRDEFPPDWMKPDVVYVLDLTAASTLYTRNGLVDHYAWLKPDTGTTAHPIGDDRSEVTHILVERGYLLWAESAALTNESGETFTAERMVFTPTGRQLHEQLNQRK